MVIGFGRSSKEASTIGGGSAIWMTLSDDRGLSSEAFGVYERIAMGEEGFPHGVSGDGRRASGLKGGEGREERPVPPIIPMETGSTLVLATNIIGDSVPLANLGIQWGACPFCPQMI